MHSVCTLMAASSLLCLVTEDRHVYCQVLQKVGSDQCFYECVSFSVCVCFRLQPHSSLSNQPRSLALSSGTIIWVPLRLLKVCSFSTRIHTPTALCLPGNFQRRHSCTLSHMLTAFYLFTFALNQNFCVKVQQAAYNFSQNRIKHVYRYSFSSELLKGWLQRYGSV